MRATTNMPRDPLKVVRSGLQAYADRGVFRGFDEVKARNGKPEFKFAWLGSRLLKFTLDPQTGVLSFSNLLPNVPANSMLYTDLKRFFESRSDRAIPKHRRIDPARAELSWINRRGNVSIALKVHNRQYGYGVKKLINLVHEVFVLLNDSYADYMSENFDLPQE